MSIASIPIRPGVDTEDTALAESGGWTGSNLVRFRNDHAETIGAWRTIPTSSVPVVNGNCRFISQWQDSDSSDHIIFGCDDRLFHTKAIASSGSSLANITPIRHEGTISADFVAYTAGDEDIVLTGQTAHGALIGDEVFLPSVSAYASIVGIVEDETITLNIGGDDGEISAANAALLKAGDKVQYEEPLGRRGAPSSFTSSSGWGAAEQWGVGPWGQGIGATEIAAREEFAPVMWHGDNYGEDFVFNVRGGKLFYLKTTTPTQVIGRAEELGKIDGADDYDNIPSLASQVLVATDSRQVIALGTTDIGDQSLNPLLVRWSSIEDVLDWTPTSQNTAGSLYISQGSEIVAGRQAAQEILIWTDVSLHSMRLLGTDEVFGITLISSNIRIMSPMAHAAIGNRVYWMGVDQFYVYSGRVEEMQCPVLRHVFDNLNRAQASKCFATTNLAYNEVWFFYPSTASLECDSYVIYNFKTNLWSIGQMNRSAWLDGGGALVKPVAAQWAMEGKEEACIYEHELDEHSSSDAQATIVSGWQMIGDGNDYMMVDKFLPDIKGTHKQEVQVELWFSPDSQVLNPGQPSELGTPDCIVPVVPGNASHSKRIRCRGRQARMRITGPLGWRLGVQRANIFPFGRR